MSGIVKVICESPESFQSLLDEHAESLTLLYFTGTKDAGTGLSWCGDCTRAEPILNDALGAVESGIILICNVDRTEYRAPEYLYRTHPLVKLQCVPTLIKIINGKPLLKLGDAQCQNTDMVRDLLES